MAVAGGRPLTTGATSYYAVSTPSDLSAALTAVRDQVARCVYLTPSVPDAQGTIEIDLGGVSIPLDTSNADGWNWSNQTTGEITLSRRGLQRRFAVEHATESDRDLQHVDVEREHHQLIDVANDVVVDDVRDEHGRALTPSDCVSSSRLRDEFA